MKFLVSLVLVPACCQAAAAGEAERGHSAVPIGRSFAAIDSLMAPVDAKDDAMACLRGLCWEPQEFVVGCVAASRAGIDAVGRFPSARSTGSAQNDLVRLEWYAVKATDGTLQDAPAIIVVHESGRGMTVGRMVARGLRDRGIHAFMVQLPFYGERRPAQTTAADQEFRVVMEQGIADVRRARDAVAVLPGVDFTRVSLQGTSLGGFVAATAAGLDSAFQNVFVLLAGGDLSALVATGQRETAQLKALLARQGFEGDRLHELLNRFEPNRLAHRISPDRLWLYTATFDTTVPPIHADAFAKAAGLHQSHHIQMPATHYSGVIFLPMVLDQIAVRCGGRAVLKTK